jgi:multiple sugar transport system substrate-binding protein
MAPCGLSGLDPATGPSSDQAITTKIAKGGRGMKLFKAAITAAAAIALTSAAPAQNASINVLGHKVHQAVSTGLTAGTTGGDVTAEWQVANGAINWITADVTPLHDRIRRELALPTGNVDAAFFLNRYASPKVFEQLEPLDGYQAAKPIQDFDGLSKGMLEGMTYNGKIYGIPFRHSTTAMVYNETLLKEAGFDGPPKTFTELVEMAKKLYRVDKNGQKVYGLSQVGDSPEFLLCLMQSTGKQLLDLDYKLNANTPEFISTLKTLKDLYDNGGLIDNYLSTPLDALITDMQNGRAVMSLSPFNREVVLNDKKLSRFPGSFKVTSVPTSADGQLRAQTEVWYLVIPKNSRQKERAWDLIRTLSASEATIREALNGNGATRPAAYQDARLGAVLPSAAEQARSVASARLALPGFDETTRAQAILSEEADSFLLGQQSAETAAANIQRRIEPLLPKKQ